VSDHRTAGVSAEALLRGQVAIVTGAGRGIGRAIASVLAGHGMRVVLSARSTDQIREAESAIAALGGESLALPCDVTQRADVEQAMAHVEDAFGPVDLLVNNAGSLKGIGPIWEADPDAWWMDVTTILLGTMLCSRAVLPSMIDRRQGRIVNVASVAGLSANPGGSGYTAAKQGLIRFTESLAASTAEYGIPVFAIDPGLVPTELTESLTTHPVGRRYYERLHDNFAVAATPAVETGKLVAYLATGQADGLSGRFFSVEDDYENLARDAEEIVRQDWYQVRLQRPPGARPYLRGQGHHRPPEPEAGRSGA